MPTKTDKKNVIRQGIIEVVDFIFSKDASVAKYDTLLVEDKSKTLPEHIKHLISDSIR